MTEPTPTIIEAAFLFVGDEAKWLARITYKCPICRRRNYVLKRSRNEGPMKDHLPLEVECKQGHKTLVVPYRWNESQANHKVAA
jgi:hypothetical protein